MDTAEYRVSALNVKGEMSSVATIVVKSKSSLSSLVSSYVCRRKSTVL